MFILIDNYDSFTYNLFHYLGELGARLEVHRNDKITVDEVMAKHPQGIILSPGPCTPDTAGICLDLIKRAAGKVPIFGVCLGHQAIGQVYGGDVVRAPKRCTASSRRCTTPARACSATCRTISNATRYHSLTIDPPSFPSALEITATSEDGVIQGLQHKTLPIFGVQFHPESIASEHGHRILANFLQDCGTNIRTDLPKIDRVA